MNVSPVGTSCPLPTPTVLQPAAPSPQGGEAFGRVLDQVLGQAGLQQTQADQLVRDLAVGRTDSIHDVMLAVAKADLSFRLVLEIRNRLAEAYQEIQRMQV